MLLGAVTARSEKQCMHAVKSLGTKSRRKVILLQLFHRWGAEVQTCEVSLTSTVGATSSAKGLHCQNKAKLSI